MWNVLYIAAALVVLPIHIASVHAQTGCAPAQSCLACAGDSCTSCNSGSYLGPWTESPDRTACLSCQWPCQTCSGSATSCLTCYQGYYKSGGTCLQCNPGCGECSSASTCITCNTFDNYVRDPATGACTKCPVGTHTDFDNPNVCTACPAGCLNCFTTGICIGCAPGYFNNMEYKTDLCILCPSDCVLCADTLGFDSKCTTCAPGKYLDANGRCQTCEPTCASCTGPDACQTCPPGYIVGAGGKCVLSPSAGAKLGYRHSPGLCRDGSYGCSSS